MATGTDLVIAAVILIFNLSIWWILQGIKYTPRKPQPPKWTAALIGRVILEAFGDYPTKSSTFGWIYRKDLIRALSETDTRILDEVTDTIRVISKMHPNVPRNVTAADWAPKPVKLCGGLSGHLSGQTGAS